MKMRSFNQLQKGDQQAQQKMGFDLVLTSFHPGLVFLGQSENRFYPGLKTLALDG